MFLLRDHLRARGNKRAVFMVGFPYAVPLTYGPGPTNHHIKPRIDKEDLSSSNSIWKTTKQKAG